MNPDEQAGDLEVVSQEEIDNEFGTMPSLSVYMAHNVAAFSSELAAMLRATGVKDCAVVSRCATAYTDRLMSYWITKELRSDQPTFYEFTNS